MNPSAPSVARAFASRDFRIALSYRLPFAADVFAVVFALVEVYFIAELVPPGRVTGGYFTFVVIGLVVAAMIAAGTTALATGVRNEQMQGTLEVIAALEMPPSRLSVGLAAYPVVAASIRAGFFLVAGLALGARFPGADVLTALVALILGSLAFVGIGLVGAAVVIVFRQATAAIAWLVGLLTFAAGVAFPTDVLPAWLRALASLSPVTVTLRVVRSSLLEADAPVAGDLVVLTLMAVVGIVVGVGALAVGLRWARRAGTLALY